MKLSGEFPLANLADINKSSVFSAIILHYDAFRDCVGNSTDPTCVRTLFTNFPLISTEQKTYR
jgi:hypothetical protein